MLAMLSLQLANTQHTIKLLYFAKANEHQCVEELAALAERYAHFSYLLLTRDISPQKKTGVGRNLKTGELSDNGEQFIQLCVSQAVSDLELQL